MPKMKTFLEENGPWSQLIDIQNIVIEKLQKDLNKLKVKKTKKKSTKARKS